MKETKTEGGGSGGSISTQRGFARGFSGYISSLKPLGGHAHVFSRSVRTAVAIQVN